MDWEHMPYFLAVARRGSLRAAADELNATHGTVNRHLQALENSYGAQLFKRQRSGLELTPAGTALLPVAEDAEELMISARRRLQGLDREEAGQVRVSLPSTIAYELVSPIFARFAKAHPYIDLEIRLSDTFEDITRFETDVSMRVAFEITDDVVARRLFNYGVGVYASKDYLDQHFTSAGERGEGLNWIGWGDPKMAASWTAGSPFSQAETRHNVSDGVMRMQLLRQGAGMTQMPVFYEQFYPDLCRVPGTEIELSRSIWLLLHSDLRRTTRVRRFVDFMVDGLKELRPLIQNGLGRDPYTPQK